jgi:hypothetical protein
MEDKFIPKAISNSLTEAPVYEMDVMIREQPKRSLWERLTKRDYEPETSRRLVFYESYVDVQYKIAGEASLLPDEIFQDQSNNIALIPEHLPRVIYMIALALANDGKEPDRELIKFLQSNLKGRQLRDALVATFQGMNMEAFTDTIVLMKGTARILIPQETSPIDGSE